MKEKEILDKIKEDIINITPNVKASIIAKSNLSKNKKPLNFNFLKALIPALSVIIVIFSLILFKKPTEIIQIESTKTEEEIAKYLTTSVITYQNNANLYNITLDDFNEEVYIFHKYMQIVESHMYSNNEYELYENDDKNYKKYFYKMIVKNTNLVGEESLIIIYFNERIELDDSELEKIQTGVVLINNTEYKFESELEVEKDEIELEVTLVNNFEKIVMKKEVEDKEIEFEYEYYLNNKLIEKIKFDHEEDELDLKVTFNNKLYNYNVNIINEYLIKIIIKGYEIELIIDNDTKRYRYSYLNKRIKEY